MSICVEQERNGPPGADQDFLQPATTAVMCQSDTHPYQNISSKWDCMHQLTNFHSSIIKGLTSYLSCLYKTV